MLKKLASYKDVVVCKPDKGNGIVPIDRPKYVQSMTAVISDAPKFEPMVTPIGKYVPKTEDKINNFLWKMKNLGFMSESVFKNLFVTASGPGVLYGLPKVHKPDFSTKFPFHHIFAAYNTPSFNIAKYLLPVLSPLTTNEFTVDNSCKFSERVTNIHNANNLFMTSFDVESLFTNVPLHETIDICPNSLFTCPASVVLGLAKGFFLVFA